MYNILCFSICMTGDRDHRVRKIPVFYAIFGIFIRKLSENSYLFNICRKCQNEVSEWVSECYRFSIYICRYTDISDSHLEDLIWRIRLVHPNAGYRYLNGHLNSNNIRVSRAQLLRTIIEVDGREKVAMRLASRVTRVPVYGVPFTNYLWHLDGTHKLIR